jgi:hypothetical protein
MVMKVMGTLEHHIGLMFGIALVLSELGRRQAYRDK